MRKNLFPIFALLLSACGGGGSTPYGEIPPINRTESVAQSNARITSMITNSKYQVARYVANQLGEADAASINLVRGATARGAFVPAETGNENYDRAQEIIDLAAWLVDNNTSMDDIREKYDTSSADANKIKLALKLLRARDLYQGGDHSAETAENIVNNRASLAAPLAQLQHDTQIFDINTVRFDLAGGHFSDYGQKISFSTDGRGRIKDISLSDDSRFEGIGRNGEDSTFSVTNRPIYHYTLQIDGDDDIFVEGVTSIKELKDKLKNKLATKFGENTTEYNNYKDEVDAITENTFVTNTEERGKKILDATFRPEFAGKDVGLRYSDFGLMHITTHFHGRDPEDISEAIAGGYTNNEFAENVIQTSMHFTGRAIGTVQYRRYAQTDPMAEEVLVDTDTLGLDGEASMDFDPASASQQVQMNFGNWYNVSADTAGNITFSEYTGSTDNNHFRFNTENISGAAVNYDRTDDGMMADSAPEIVVRYFGDDVASESVGYVKVGEDRDIGANSYENVLFNAGFGMKTPDEN